MSFKSAGIAAGVLSILFFLGRAPLAGDEISLRKSQFNLQGGVAIQGYDPVSYFAQGEARKGSSSIAYNYKGVVYHFSSTKNRSLFKKNPERYEPAYGGWCAYAMGDDGSKVEVDPGTFKIKDGVLYLFYNFYFINTLPKWNADEKRLKERADRFWRDYMQGRNVSGR